jgi:hypothetical protein
MGDSVEWYYYSIYCGGHRFRGKFIAAKTARRTVHQIWETQRLARCLVVFPVSFCLDALAKRSRRIWRTKDLKSQNVASWKCSRSWLLAGAVRMESTHSARLSALVNSHIEPDICILSLPAPNLRSAHSTTQTFAETSLQSRCRSRTRHCKRYYRAPGCEGREIKPANCTGSSSERSRRRPPWPSSRSRSSGHNRRRSRGSCAWRS